MRLAVAASGRCIERLRDPSRPRNAARAIMWTTARGRVDLVVDLDHCQYVPFDSFSIDEFLALQRQDAGRPARLAFSLRPNLPVLECVCGVSPAQGGGATSPAASARPVSIGADLGESAKTFSAASPPGDA